MLEKRRYSITRLKQVCHACGGTRNSSWKEKILDYEIETQFIGEDGNLEFETWKEKILDYEIETFSFGYDTPECGILEKRRYSITRLKHYHRENTWSFIVSWKEKILDSEIETSPTSCLRACSSAHLKREDTRLRDWNCPVRAFQRQVVYQTWKEKILDSEIETP